MGIVSLQHELFVCISCLQHRCAWGYHRNCNILMSWKALNKHTKSPTHKNATEYWHDQMHSQGRSKHHGTVVTAEDLNSNFMMERDDNNETSTKNSTKLNDQQPPPIVMTVGQLIYSINDKKHQFQSQVPQNCDDDVEMKKEQVMWVEI